MCYHLKRIPMKKFVFAISSALMLAACNGAHNKTGGATRDSGASHGNSGPADTSASTHSGAAGAATSDTSHTGDSPAVDSAKHK